ncbi:MAG TPA: hypothetical protein ENK04_01595 [Gammaproteobacteria bacterium]|nr:hypothetical protein [Gammaproteobacteria bacterium]
MTAHQHNPQQKHAPISQHFCATCNRVRLTASGTLFLCLGQEHMIELREALRQGLSDTALKVLLGSALALKPERHSFKEKPQHVVRFMSKTGG